MRKVKPVLGPLSVDVLKPKKSVDKRVILTEKFLHDAIRPLKKDYAINLNILEDKDITKPKIYIDGQLCIVGFIQFPELVVLLDNVIKEKKDLVQKAIQQYESMKQKNAWWIVYRTLTFKDSRTEILVPSKNIMVQEKNFRPDIRIKRDGFPNTQPIRYGIMSRYQHIFDFRDYDVLPTEKFSMAKFGVQQTW